MIAWWQGLEPRERGLVSLAVVLLLGSALYGLVWKPVQTEHERLVARLAVLEKDLQWMVDAALEVGASGGARVQAEGGSLLSVVDSVARGDGIKSAIRQLNPDGDAIVRVNLAAVDFNRLMRWLGHLADRGVALEDMVLSRQEQPGQVQGRLTLSRK